MSEHARPTQICVLGVTHLPGEVDDALLGDVRARLLAWQPDAVVVEVLPGEQTYWQRAADPAWDQERILSCRLPVQAAAAVAGLHTWTFAEARRLARDERADRYQRALAHFACYEPFTGCLLAGEQPDERLAAACDVVRAGGRESWLIGGWLAQQRGLSRIWQLDDFTDNGLTDEDWARIGEVFYPHFHETIGALTVNVTALSPEELTALWRERNTDELRAVSEQLESEGWLRDDVPEADQRLGRLRLAEWRSRNLRMAAQLRSVTGHFPGGRVLYVVGHAHVGPICAALEVQQHDIELVSAADVLA